MIVATPTSTSGSSLRFLGAVFNMARRPEPGTTYENHWENIGKLWENSGTSEKTMGNMWEMGDKPWDFWTILWSMLMDNGAVGHLLEHSP
jgi:hypothetical protein